MMVDGAKRLPDGWEWSTLGAATNPSQKRVNPQNFPDLPYIGMENVESQTMRLLGTVPANEMRSAADSFSADDVLYGRLRPYLNKVYRPDFEGLCSTEFIIFRKVPHIHSKFLQYFLNSWDFMNFADSLNAGDRPRVKFEQLADYPFPLAPLLEQERIVSRIEELFSDLEAGVASLERVRAGLKRYKTSVLKAAVSGKLVNGISGTGIGELPKEWRWVKLEDVAEMRLGKMLDKEKNKGEMRPYLRNINVRWFEFDLSDIQYMRVLDSELENISVRKGDLVVCEGGEPGRAAVWNNDEPMIIQKALHRVRLNDDVLPTYVVFCLSTDATTGKLEKYFTGSTIKHFTGQSLRTYKFPLPPLDEQRRIVAEVERRLSVVGEVESAMEVGLVRAGRLRQAVLRSAFEGSL